MDTIQGVIRRLVEAGLEEAEIRHKAIPAWWEDSCADEPDGGASALCQVAFGIARHCDVDLDALFEPSVILHPSGIITIQLESPAAEENGMADAYYRRKFLGEESPECAI